MTDIAYETIPQPLRNRAQWVLWKKERDTKVPYDAKTGRRASSTDPSTWGTFERAVKAYQRGGYAGIGYVFSADDPYVGIDFDDCIVDGVLQDWAAQAIESLHSYTEVSPSGNGVKIWTIGDIATNVTKPPIELYSSKRFFTVTGQHLDNTPQDICHANGALTALYERAKNDPQDAVSFTADTAAPPDYAAYAQAAFADELTKLARATEGNRNNQLNESALKLAQFFPHRLLDENAVRSALEGVARSIGLPPREIAGTIRSGFEAGKQEPRELPDPRQNRYGVTKSILPAHITDNAAPDVLSLLIDANHTDAGNAECMALLYGDQFRYCHTRTKWLVWDGNRWAIDTDGRVERAALDVARARQAAALGIEDLDRKKKAVGWGFASESSGKRAAAIQTAAILEQFATTVDQYDRNILLAAVSNGTLDLHQGTYRPSQRDDYLTMQLGTSYDAHADCPRWKQFLSEIFNGDQELIAYIQRAVGYSLTGDTSEQKLFLCHGGGANGKSVFLEILSALLGEYAGNASFDTFDAGRRNEATNDLAALKGKRLVTVIETEEDRRLAEARVKAVTGQDAISCRFLYGEFFTYKPQFKIWLAMNHKPIIRGTDRGIWRRIQLIPFTQNFEGREDQHLADKLRAELPGILNWALEGLRAWQAHKLGTAAAVEQATEAYRKESNFLEQWMDECTYADPYGHMSAAEAYQSLSEWCKTNGYPVPSATSLGRVLGEKRYEKKQLGKSRQWCYLGICLGTPAEGEQVEQVEQVLGKVSLRKSASREVPEKPVQPVQPVHPVQETITPTTAPPDEESPADAARRMADEGNFTGAHFKAALIRDDVVRNALVADIKRKESHAAQEASP